MQTRQDAVVLIHGLAGNHLVLVPLWWRLRAKWPACRMWTYSSWKYGIRHHAENLLAAAENEFASFDNVHFVVHSMGSIVLRAALATRPFKNLGRTVFLGPPHRGTPMADKFCGWWGQNWRTVADLKAGEDSFVNQLPSWSYGPACVIRAQGDFLIPEDRVQLEGITQYASVPGPHSYLLFSAKAAKLAVGFIETGNLSYVDKALSGKS